MSKGLNSSFAKTMPKPKTIRANPLNVLRHYNVHRLEFEEDQAGRHFVFGEFVFAKTAKTSFFRYVINGATMAKVKAYYTLESLVFLLKHVELSHPQYVRLALSLNVPTIRWTHRKAILAYLNGEISSAPRIDGKDGPVEIPTLVKRTVDGRKLPTKKIQLPIRFRTQETRGEPLIRGSPQETPKRLLLPKTEAPHETRLSLTDVLSAEKIAAIKAKAAGTRLTRTMTDPLSLLRQYTVDKEEIVERDGQIIFGEISWPKTVKTNYSAFGSGAVKETVKEYYTLECLLYLLKNVNLAHPIYVRKAAGEKIPYIKRPDRKDLLRYLNGQSHSSKSIDEGALLEIPPRQVKRTLDDDAQVDEAVKKPRSEKT